MKKNELYFLLINTITAKNKLGINNTTLAHILGVSVDSLNRWFANKQSPSELNMYKLHWFVYLALDLKTPLSYMLHYYNIAVMDLDSDPDGGNKHLEPWNGDKFDNVLDSLFYNNTDSLIIEGDDDEVPFEMVNRCDSCEATNCPYNATFDTDDEEDELFDEADYLVDNCSLNQILAMDNARDILDSTYRLDELMENTFDLGNVSLLEAIHRMSILRDAIEDYIVHCDDYLDDFARDLENTYSKVSDYKTFADFIFLFIRAHSYDDSYSMEKGNVDVTLSYYSPDERLAIKSLDIDGIQLLDNRVVLYSGKREISFKESKNFIAKPISADSFCNLNFLIKADGQVYTLKIELE